MTWFRRRRGKKNYRFSQVFFRWFCAGLKFVSSFNLHKSRDRYSSESNWQTLAHSLDIWMPSWLRRMHGKLSAIETIKTENNPTRKNVSKMWNSWFSPKKKKTGARKNIRKYFACLKKLFHELKRNFSILCAQSTYMTTFDVVFISRFDVFWNIYRQWCCYSANDLCLAPHIQAMFAVICLLFASDGQRSVQKPS